MEKPNLPTAFAVEKTLGRLGKWLRLLGFDAMLESDCPQGAFRDGPPAGRTLLTRTHSRFRAHAALKPVFIESNDPFEQLAEVIAQTGIGREDLRPFTRCLRCNAAITAVAREEVARSVPEYVWESHQAFSRCPQCGRVYWRGSHTARSLNRIDKLFE